MHVPNLGVLLERVRRVLYPAVTAAFPHAGFTDLREAHGSVLAFLPEAGSRLTQLAERARVTKQSMGALVRELEALGYVRRVPDPTDGRAKIIVFTPRGREATEVARATIRETEREWASAVGEERLEIVRRTLLEITSPV